MDEDRFWTIIDGARRDVEASGGTVRDWFEALRVRLGAETPEEILQFRRRFDRLTAAAYQTDLWGAASLINGGCSDDGFHYFRSWLVGQGKDVYEKALVDPDSLADILDGEWPVEAALDAAPARAWEGKTGRTDAEFYQELDRLGAPIAEGDGGEEGEDWDFEDEEELQRRFPRLAQLYLEE